MQAALVGRRDGGRAKRNASVDGDDDVIFAND